MSKRPDNGAQNANASGAVPAPVVIGAIGGSGTRIVARIARAAGYFIGTNLNESEDAMDFVEFYDRWINRYLLRNAAPLCYEEERLLLGDFEASIARHRSTIPNEHASWGWKEPRSIYVQEFFHQRFPKMKFIHVVRDGRDMAFSSNQNQLRKHGRAVLGQLVNELPQPVATAVLWAEVNTRAARYGDENMAGSYLRVRYEQLCAEPVSTIKEMLEFLDRPATDPLPLAQEVKATTIGRWRTVEDSTLIGQIHSYAGEALKRFGYL